MDSFDDLLAKQNLRELLHGLSEVGGNNLAECLGVSDAKGEKAAGNAGMGRRVSTFSSWSPEKAAAISAKNRAARGILVTPTKRYDLRDERCAMPKPERDGWPVFEAMLRANKLPLPVYEYRFDPVRKWRFDMAWPDQPSLKRIAVEVNGGVWSEGRHTRGQGFINDMEKLNAAQLAGWIVLQYTPDNLARAIDDLKSLLA